MKLTGLVTIATLLAATGAPVLAQGTTQGATRYSIDGPGGGVPTSRPPATRPVPPATTICPYGRPPRHAPPAGRPGNLPPGSR